MKTLVSKFYDHVYFLKVCTAIQCNNRNNYFLGNRSNMADFRF